MKTKSLFVSIFVLTLFMSCAENAVELPKNPPKHLVVSHAMQNITENLGLLHNSGVMEFFDYVENHNISPYENYSLTDDLIESFSSGYVQNNLDINYYYAYLDENLSIDVDELSLYENDIFQIFENSSYSPNDMESAIRSLTEDYHGDTENETYIQPIEMVSSIAIGTNYLWGVVWDMDNYSFIQDSYLQAVSDSTTDEKKKEDQQKLKKADVRGAIEGIISGYNRGGAEGALVGALVGAIYESIKEKIIQELDKVAVAMTEDDVCHINEQSYFYEFIQTQKELNIETFYERYGDKFDVILQ